MAKYLFKKKVLEEHVIEYSYAVEADDIEAATTLVENDYYLYEVDKDTLDIETIDDWHTELECINKPKPIIIFDMETLPTYLG